VTVAISTDGRAPGLAGLLREAIDAVLPQEIGEWLAVARRERDHWRRDGVPMSARRPLLLRALNRIYGTAEHAERAEQMAFSASPANSAVDPNGRQP
jgi:uroporphyrin-III C-methyltransferase/precorrin-2 dehydrogenase/sirohydrochlorin ferrochelatase